MNVLNNICRHQQVFARCSSFVSALSPSSLYPNSTTTWQPNACAEEAQSVIPIDKLQITYSRSTGPGGQNTNKVNTKVDLRFHVESATWINDAIKSKLSEHYKSKISKDGFIIFRSDATRSQQLNLADCLQKLRTCLARMSAPATICEEDQLETAEKRRKRMDRAVRQRLEWKRARSEVKDSRRSGMDIE